MINNRSFNQTRDSGLRTRSEGQRALKRPDQDFATVKFNFTRSTSVSCRYHDAERMAHWYAMQKPVEYVKDQP
jgi:hypothetical protein